MFPVNIRNFPNVYGFCKITTFFPYLQKKNRKVLRRVSKSCNTGINK